MTATEKYFQFRRWKTGTEPEPESHVYRTRTEHQSLFKKYSEPNRSEPLSQKNPNRIRTHNFGFFPISSHIHVHTRPHRSKNFI